ncbi:thioesterase family protein [Actinopolyspora erythraea]|uniref:thioesterase family protein n=1 Tax=Actinopolyspora erythraea TaxID=414996 RepID=UPI000AE0A5A1|nr:thioesterase family protein [Actinopolyspora erythraea]
MTAVPTSSTPETTEHDFEERWDEAVRTLLETSGSTRSRPGYEGCTVSTSLGFRHINYLAEAAVLEHFRSAGLAPGMLYDEFGLGLDVVHIDTRLPKNLHVDDLATLFVKPVHTPDDTRMRFDVTSTVSRAGRSVTNARSTLEVLLRVEPGVDARSTVPAGLERFVTERLGTAEPVELTVDPASRPDLGSGRGTTVGRDSRRDPVLNELIGENNAFGWKWRVPYFYCHFGDRMPVSGFLRLLEEVVDLFLADRGLDVKRVLDERHWIPVVTHSRLDLLDEVRMEEDLYTVYTVEEVFKSLLYTSRMDCYVVRDGRLVPTATGRITHGYMTQRSDGTWELVTFDEPTLRALSGENR